jgi:hypothetical protein
MSPAPPAGSFSDLKLQAHGVVHGASELLLAPEVSLGRLDGHVAEREMNLVEFADVRISAVYEYIHQHEGALVSGAYSASLPSPRNMRWHRVMPGDEIARTPGFV